MAYVNMYASVSDNNNYVRSTSSQRGQVNSVSCWINSILGSVLKASARYIDFPVPYVERKGKTLEQYKREKEIMEQSAEGQRKVVIDIDIESNEKFILRINGQNISISSLKALAEWDMQRFNLQLERMAKLRDEGKINQMFALAQIMR